MTKYGKIMKLYIRKVLGIILCLISCVLVSCTNDEDPMLTVFESDCAWHSAKLNLSFKANANSRGIDNVWIPDDNDLICIQFYQAGNIVGKGYATYDSSSDNWNLTYQGKLEKGKYFNCKVMYFGSSTVDKTSLNVTLTNQNPCFICNEAEYKVVSDDVLDLYADLSPNCFRMRFKGDETCEFQYRGPFLYDNYNLNDDETTIINSYYTPLSGNILTTNDGFLSPYYYCTPEKMVAFRLKCGSKVYKYKTDMYGNREFTKAGTSNTVLMPSLSPDNWISDDYITWALSETSYSLSYNANQTIAANLHSKVGVLVTFTYTITSLSTTTNEDDYGFYLQFDAYDDERSFFKTSQYYIPNWIDSECVGITEESTEYVFIDEADIYDLSLKTTGVKVSVTDIKVSSF